MTKETNKEGEHKKKKNWKTNPTKEEEAKEINNTENSESIHLLSEINSSFIVEENPFCNLSCLKSKTSKNIPLKNGTSFRSDRLASWTITPNHKQQKSYEAQTHSAAAVM
jgi:hypothetical protein